MCRERFANFAYRTVNRLLKVKSVHACNSGSRARTSGEVAWARNACPIYQDGSHIAFGGNVGEVAILSVVGAFLTDVQIVVHDVS